MKKKIFALILMVSLTACSQAPNLSNPAPIVGKTTKKYSNKTVCIYEVAQNNEGLRGRGWGTILFEAPVDLAEVGDILVVQDGAWKVKK